MKTTNVTVAQLRDILATVKGATPVSFIAVTDAGCRKTDNPHVALSPVYKVARVSAMIGTDHEAAVERQQGREGAVDPSYTAAPRTWGTRIGAALVQKGSDYYLPAQLNPAVKRNPIYLAAQMRAGRPRLVPIATAEIAPYLPADRRAAVAAHQGVARPVERRDYKLTGIVALSMGERHYRVRA
jgi:hypothetical protein